MSTRRVPSGNQVARLCCTKVALADATNVIIAADRVNPVSSILPTAMAYVRSCNPLYFLFYFLKQTVRNLIPVNFRQRRIEQIGIDRAI